MGGIYARSRAEANFSIIPGTSKDSLIFCLVTRQEKGIKDDNTLVEACEHSLLGCVFQGHISVSLVQNHDLRLE